MFSEKNMRVFAGIRGGSLPRSCGEGMAMPGKLNITFGEIYFWDRVYCTADVYLDGEAIGTIEHNALYRPKFRGWHFLGREVYGHINEATGASKVRFMPLPFSRSTLMRRWREHQRGPEFATRLTDWKRSKWPWQDSMLPKDMR